LKTPLEIINALDVGCDLAIIAEEKIDPELIKMNLELIRGQLEKLSYASPASQGVQNGGQILETITFEIKDLVELLSFIDMSLQPDFPINKARGLISKLKKICLKYGINWTGRQF